MIRFMKFQNKNEKNQTAFGNGTHVPCATRP